MPVFPEPPTYIKHRGFLDFEKLLKSIRQWFIDEDFGSINIPVHLQKYPTTTGVEHEFRYKCEKVVTEYVKFNFEIFMRAFNLRDIEIVHEGKKMKMQEGQIMIEIIPSLELDWQKRFSGPAPWKSFLAALDEFYRNYIIKYKICDYWDDMILLKSAQLARTIRETLGQEVM